MYVTHRLRALIPSCLLAALCAIVPPAHALDPAISIDGYRHDRWGEAEGAPRFIDTLAQTPDGWLWVAGRQAGLFRFDGVRFHPYETVDGSKLQTPGITVLRPARDGALWIGHGRGGVTVLRGGRYRHLLAAAQTGAVYAIAEGNDGAAWAATGRGLFRIAGGHVDRVGTERGYPNARAEYVLADGAGRLWAVDGQSLYVMAPGASAFERVRAANANAMVIEAGDGGIWLVQGKAFARVAPPSARRVPLPAGRSSSFQSVFDRDGNLWSGNCPVGVCVLRPAHWRHGDSFTPVDAAERFDQPWQMTSLSVVSMMEGRDGGIWIGTPSGLERLRDQPVHMVSELFDRGKSHAAPAADGSVHTVQVRRFDDTASLRRIAGGKVEPLPDPLAAQALDRAPDGTLVLAGEHGIALQGKDGVRRIALPPGLAGSGNLRITKVVAGLGEFWLWTARPGVWHYRNGAWMARPANLDDAPSTVAADVAGRSYLGLPGNRLRIVDGAGTRDYDAADGIATGRIMFIWPGAPLLVSGPDGTQFLAGGRFHALRTDAPGGLGLVNGVAEGADGTRWLNAERGIFRVRAADWARTVDDPRVPLRGTLFDSFEGYVGGGETTHLTDTAFATPDGRLWFAGERGLAWVDPAKLPAPVAMPDVEMLSVTAGGRRHRAGAPLRLPEGTGDVQVDYTVPSLRTPQRVTFRYRMAGSDAWQDAGTRRTAFFQRLGPGDHAFEVMAFDEHGTASRVTTLRFHIAPSFTQTWWFRGGTALAVAFVIALAYRLRTRRMAARIEERLLVRVRERESIARSLHDTFLQSVQGMLLSLHSVMVKLPVDSPARVEFERVLRRAEHVLVEGRDEVRGLRGEFGSADDFWQALLRDVDVIAPGSDTRVRLVAPDAMGRLQPKVRRDVHAIAREALANALRHTSGPVTLLADADARAFTLSVSDEGPGLGPFADGKPGHFGLPGMRERAAQIGARLHVESGERGTCVILVIPAGHAYGTGADNGIGGAIRTGA